MNQPAMKFEFRLTRANLIALAGLCILAGASLAWAMVGTNRLWFTNRLPVDRAKVRAATEKIDPNIASPASLRRLPGIGIVRAQNIVLYRREHAPRPFRTAGDLSKIPGIGKGTVRKVSPYLAIPLCAADVRAY